MGKKKGKKVRVSFRRNRSKPPRVKDWTDKSLKEGDQETDTENSQNVVAKGDLSRKRTIIVSEDGAAGQDLHAGVVIAMRGLYADVDDGERVWACTVRQVLRTRMIDERQAVTVGDRVRFRIEETGEKEAREGVVVEVDPRKGVLRRQAGRRIQTIAANIDQAIIVTSAREPRPKFHLIDRYLVACHAGEIKPIICMNKIDLDTDGASAAQVRLYEELGYGVIPTSAATGDGIDALREVLTNQATVIAGQSGVGKSSLLNAVQPGLKLRVGDIIEQIGKGKHTTTTAVMIRLEVGGYVVDTPGIRSFDLTVIPRHEYEAHFVEFVECLSDCKFPDCTHTHEGECAVKSAVERGKIHPDRYLSYVQMYEDPGITP